MGLIHWAKGMRAAMDVISQWGRNSPEMEEEPGGRESVWTMGPSCRLRAAPTYKAVTLELVLVPEASTSDLVTPSQASLSMARLSNASGALTGSSFTSSRSLQHLLQRQHVEQPHSSQQTRQQTRQQQQQRLWKQLVREVMSLSQGSRERSHTGRKAQLRSFWGKAPGQKDCRILRTTTSKITRTKGEATPTSTGQPIRERPKTPRGITKKMTIK